MVEALRSNIYAADVQKLHSSRFEMPGRRPRLPHGLALAGLLLLAACQQNIPKADALEAQADGLMTGQAYIAAIDQLQKAVKYDSNEPRRWVKLGRAQRAAGMSALAAMSFQHALDLDPANVESLQNLAILEVRAGRYDEAKTYVDPLMVLSPDDVAGLLAMGAIALYQKKLSDGLGYSEKLIRIAPQSLGGYSLKAHILDAMGRPGEAAKVLAQQSLFNPDDKELTLQLLQLYQKAGSVQGVRETSINLARLIPDDPRYQMEAARAAFASGDKTKADGIVDRVVNRYLYLPEIGLAAAQYWQGTRAPDEATARILQLTARARGRTKAMLADVLIGTGHAREVAAMLAPLEKAEATIGNADVMACYAKALLVLGQLDRAKTVADTVLLFDPGIETALIVRSKIAFARKQYAAALNDAQQAASGDVLNVEAAILVPRIYSAWGNQTLAANAWGDASSHLPDSIEVMSERAKWLIANGQVGAAKGLTAYFARGHAGKSAAWELYRISCVAMKDDACADEAAAQVKALRSRGR